MCGLVCDPRNWAAAKRAHVRIGTVIKVRAALFDHAAVNDGDLGGFDPEGWAAMLGMREDKLVAVIEALTDKQVIVEGRLADFGDAERHRDASPASQRHSDDPVTRRREQGRLRTQRYRARQAGDAVPSPSVTASPLLEEEREQDISISSDAQTHASNPWGGAGSQAQASRATAKERWLAKTLAEAQTMKAPAEFSRFYMAAYEEPRPRWAQLELDRIDALVRQRDGKAAPPSLRREPQFLLPMKRSA